MIKKFLWKLVSKFFQNEISRLQNISFNEGYELGWENHKKLIQRSEKKAKEKKGVSEKKKD